MYTQPAAVAVEITERRAPAPPEVQQQRADVVGRLDNLGQINAAAGAVASDMLVGFNVRVGGVLIPVPAVGYEIVPGESGPQVTVTFAADSVSVGLRPSVATTEGRATRAWGAGVPDPRENIPGWISEVGRG